MALLDVFVVFGLLALAIIYFMPFEIVVEEEED